MIKTKIEWCDSTWNPVTGCLHGCEYCYARKMACRFGSKLPDFSGYSGKGLYCLDNRINGNPYPFLFEPTLHAYRLDEPQKWTKPRTIFVCSMADLFGDWVPDEWIEEVFSACEKAPQHRFLFLTKNPKRYYDLVEQDNTPNGKLPVASNMWFGTTITSVRDPICWGDGWNTFLSIEPLLTDFHELTTAFSKMSVKWIIIGAETGNRKDKVVPKKEWVDNIVAAADMAGLSVFMKDSLIPIVGEENMRREFPWEQEAKT